MPNGTTVVLRPNEMFNAGDWWAVTGGSSVNAALADDSDATYATTTGNPGWVGLTNLDAIPTGARILSVKARVRWVGDGASYGAVALTDNLSGKTTVLTAFYLVPAAVATQPFQALATRPDGSAWTIDAVNSLTVEIQGSGITVRFYEVYVDVLYNRPPVVSAVTPTGNITSQQPAIGWTYTDADGDAQERWQVKVFADAVASSAGFTAATSPAAADSGTAYYAAASATQWTVPAPLSPGVYRVYVRAADAGSNGRYSDWAVGVFTVVGDPPAPPALLSVVADRAQGRVEIEVRQSDNLLNQQTATGDGIPGEFLRWYVFGNATPPTATEGGGLEANGVSSIVASNGEVALSTLRKMPVIAGLETVWAGWMAAGPSGGIMHLDIAWYSGESFRGLDEGTYVGLTGDMQPSEGKARAPDDADGALLMWRSSGPLTAGQVLTWDDCGIWFTREDELLGEQEARLAALEDAIVDLEIKVAGLEGRTPTISISPSQAPIDATAYRGGLDSSNLLGPADASFTYPLFGTHWHAYTAAGDTGLVTVPLDPAAYDGYSLAFAPATVGGVHWLLTTVTFPLPLPDAQYQFSFRHRAMSVGSSPADGLHAYGAIVWTDDNWAVTGSPVSTGMFPLDVSDEFSDPVTVTAYPPEGATRFYLEVFMTGETSVDDRWVFDQFQMVRVPDVQPDYGFGEGPFGDGPFGGTEEGEAQLVAWKPASQVDVYPYVEWSADDGATWAPVRRTEYAAYDPMTRTAWVYDYETPLGAEVLYRARTAARDYQTDPVSGAWIISAPTTTRSVTLGVDDYWLVDPFTQERVAFRLVADGGSLVQLSMSKPTPQQDFAPVGRHFKLILSDVAKGNEFTWRILVLSAADWDAMDAMIATRHVLLVQTPIGRSWYVQPGSARQITAALDGTTDHGAIIEFSGYEQQRPAA